MEIHPTYNGLPNTDDCCHEYLSSKIESAERICSKLSEQVHMVNNEMYDMHIPSDVLNGWKIMQAIHGICKKQATRYTEYPVELAIKGEFDSLECEREIIGMLCHLKFCSLNNPRENIMAKSLDLLARLLNRCSHAIDVYLDWICSTHRDVQAE